MADDSYQIDAVAYRLFGGYARKNRSTYFDVEIGLKKGNINVPLDIYVSRMLLMSTLSGLAVTVSMVIIALAAAAMSPDHTFLPWHDVASDNALINAIASQPFALFLLATASFLATFVTVYFLYKYYPIYRASARESSINQTLPHAMTFMYAMSNGGMNLLEIFRTINEHRDIYGEISIELEMVIRGVDLMGLDLLTSIKQASLITASEPLRNFFDSLAASMESGGDLAAFLRFRSDQYHQVATQERKILQELLGMLAEVYVTAFVAGPLFLIVILISMGMMTAQNPLMIQLLIYFIVPIGSIAFIYMLFIMGLANNDRNIVKARRELDEFGDVMRAKDVKPHEHDALKRAERRYNLRKFIESPAAAFLNTPHTVLYFSIPLSIIVLLALTRPSLSVPTDLLGRLNGGSFLGYQLLSDATQPVLLMLAIALLPFILFWELRNHRIRKVDAAIPEFLKRLASFNESGLTLTQAIKTLLNSNLGVLNVEVQKISRDIEWGAGTKEALIRFERRVNTASVRRIVTLITKASESSGDIKETLAIAAADATTTQSEQSERYLNMLLYTAIIYIAFFVFVYILYTLSTVFLTAMPGNTVSNPMAASGMGGMTFGGTVDVKLYQLLFMHAVIIQGFFSGMVSGMMSDGNLFSGLKHSVFMVLIGYLVFALLI
jgi:flagellar protein FlaJ